MDTLAQYRVAYETDRYHLREVYEPRLYATRAWIPQPFLPVLEASRWQPIQRLSPYRPGRHRTAIDNQMPLLPRELTVRSGEVPDLISDHRWTPPVSRMFLRGLFPRPLLQITEGSHVGRQMCLKAVRSNRRLTTHGNLSPLIAVNARTTITWCLYLNSTPTVAANVAQSEDTDPPTPLNEWHGSIARWNTFRSSRWRHNCTQTKGQPGPFHKPELVGGSRVTGGDPHEPCRVQPGGRSPVRF
jgi:hypothetical protein